MRTLVVVEYPGRPRLSGYNGSDLATLLHLVRFFPKRLSEILSLADPNKKTRLVSGFLSAAIIRFYAAYFRILRRRAVAPKPIAPKPSRTTEDGSGVV